MHRARRMRLGNVERGEIVPVVLDLRTTRHGKTHVGEDFGQFVHNLADRVDRAAGKFRRGEREIDRLGGKARFEYGAFERGLALCQRCGDSLTRGVDFRAFALPLVRRHAAQRFEQRAYPSLLAEGGDADRLHRIGRGRGGNGAERFGLLLIELFHARSR